MPTDVKISVSLVWIIVLVLGAILIRPFLCHQRNPTWDNSRVVAWLKDRGYMAASEAKSNKPDSLPDSIKETATATGYGTSTWIPEETYSPGDSIPVELSTIELPDGTWWARLSIDGKPVEWTRLEFHREVVRRNWCAFVELAAVSSDSGQSSPLGVGVGYTIWRPVAVNITPSVAVSTTFDWVAPELRLSRNVWSGVSVGGGVGYRLGEDDGLHLSASIGVEL